MSEEIVDTVEEFDAIRSAYEETGDLTDDQVDKVADAAIEILRSILGCFGENNSSIDEYDGDEGELILDVNGGNLAILIGRHGDSRCPSGCLLFHAFQEDWLPLSDRCRY